ncbi:heterogeneous nuclear ribonucleoprotein U-like protein 1 isoform X2 [Nematostella vectensis]|uniref:heterogeneous nuclear ribonucleoprotein U-like protein 1 isoform X2 n=1 Tax=Nematostella vectensis TaxID=45351 RepID=UPI00139034B8|nr:heterogeneous nuclear ribonucleoprotein U-like protein 1 isoform X2 [Nematostella vectensis]
MDRFRHPHGQPVNKTQDYARDLPRQPWSSASIYCPGPAPYPPPRQRVLLDDHNSDLHFVIEQDGVTGGNHSAPGFDYMWAGARASHGVKSGKIFFEVTVLDKLPVDLPETETTPHVVRVGWSVDSANLQVGEDALSYGYGGTAKCSVSNKFFDYGERYSSNDIITCYIDLDASPKCIFFAKNGLYLGVAFRLGPEAYNKAFYPHVTVKNMRVRVNFGGFAPYFPPIQGFRMIEDAEQPLLIPGTRGPASQRDCQVIMMVGLPGAGKTYWAEKYVKDHPEKKFNILGTNAIMDKMKVMNLARRHNYHGRWDALIKQASDILNKVLKIAERKNRNYILDQTNVYPNARRRKMNNFRGFHRIAAVLVTTNEVLKERTERRENLEGKKVPVEAVMEMKANFTLPEVGEIFNEVWFIEESKESSVRLVEQFRAEGQEFKDSEKKRKPEDDRSSGPSDFKRMQTDCPPSQHGPQSFDYDHKTVGESPVPSHDLPARDQDNKSSDIHPAAPGFAPNVEQDRYAPRAEPHRYTSRTDSYRYGPPGDVYTPDSTTKPSRADFKPPRVYPEGTLSR